MIRKTDPHVVRRLELVEAQKDALRDALAELVGYVRRAGGFMEHTDQEILWRAEAALAEAKG